METAVARQSWPATTVSGGLCRAGGHEPRRPDVALRRGWSGTFVPAGGRRDSKWQTAAETRAAEIRGVAQPWRVFYRFFNYQRIVLPLLLGLPYVLRVLMVQ